MNNTRNESQMRPINGHQKRVSETKGISGRLLWDRKTKQDFSTVWQDFSPGHVKKCPQLSQRDIGQFSRGI